MNRDLENKINEIFKRLEEDIDSIVFAKMTFANNSRYLSNNDYMKKYEAFLEICDGARFGGIDLWNEELINENQYRVESIPGGKEKWICIGQILYEPLVINKTDGKVYMFYQGLEDEEKPLEFGNFDNFLEQYVLGKKYTEIIPNAEEDDDWFDFLIKNNLLD